MFQFWAAVSNEREDGGAANAHGRRMRTKGMVIDEAHGRRVQRTDEEHCRWISAEDENRIDGRREGGRWCLGQRL